MEVVAAFRTTARGATSLWYGAEAHVTDEPHRGISSSTYYICIHDFVVRLKVEELERPTRRALRVWWCNGGGWLHGVHSAITLTLKEGEGSG